MASFIARRTARSLNFSRLSYVGCSRRAIHLTPVVQKKKASVEVDDLFAEESTIEEDLFKSDAVTKPSHVAQASASTSKPKATTNKYADLGRKLSPEKRLARFEEIIAFITPRLGRKPAIAKPQVRNSAWSHLVELATTEEQLTRVVDMFPAWIATGGHFTGTFSELFVRRCEQLNCPHLALKVYGDYAKYNIPLPLPAARQLLHSVHTKHPIDAVMTAAALYEVYGLGAFSQDAVSCSMVMVACFKHNSKQTLQLANDLVPHLQSLLKRTKPKKVEISPAKTYQERPYLWLKWALQKVDKALTTQTGAKVNWLDVWRRKSGHIPVPAKA